MTVRRGEDWGAPGPLGPEGVVVLDDAGAAAALRSTWTEGGHPPEVGLVGGDLHRTLGAPHHDADDLRSGRGMRHPMDLATVRLDGGGPQLFCSHLVATASRRGGLWRTHTVVAMNGAFVGDQDLGPRAHPGDGRLDLTEGVLPPGQVRAGRRRSRTGTHLPHPALRERRGAHLVVEAPRRLWVRLDGVPVGWASHLELTCHPDAWVAVV